MKSHLASLIFQALRQLGIDPLPDSSTVEATIERARQRGHGDFASTIGFLLSKTTRQAPRALAEQVCAALAASPDVDHTEVAGAGFINFYLRAGRRQQIVRRILEAGAGYGQLTLGAGKRILLEFVSANPNGPLHVGHGRGAAFGDSLARLLAAAGYEVQREYYVNDAGRQMDILAVSVWLRYLERLGVELPFPANGYRGDYVRDIAGNLEAAHHDAFSHTSAAVLTGLPADEPQGGDKERYIDALIERGRTLLGADGYHTVHSFGLQAMLADIRADLAEFGVHYDRWFSEHSLFADGAVDDALAALKAAGHTYSSEGALWFRSTTFGDEKDRVLVRENGVPTYFASDIAYHLDKLERGFDTAMDVWGADHHGHVPRVRAALAALARPPQHLEVLLVQFTVLYRGQEKVAMSTRSGDFVTLRSLRAEVGNDAARFFYVMRKNEQHMDFDLELAKSQSNDNPVFYIQYAHARIVSVFRQFQERGLSRDLAADLGVLTAPEEQTLTVTLERYPEAVKAAALAREPHQIAYYLRELATGVHSYYNAHNFLHAPVEVQGARLELLEAARQVLANGLQLVGVTAPERM